MYHMADGGAEWSMAGRCYVMDKGMVIDEAASEQPRTISSAQDPDGTSSRKRSERPLPDWTPVWAAYVRTARRIS